MAIMYVQLKSNPRLCVGVSSAAHGNQLQLQNLVQDQKNQMWRFDEASGYVYSQANPDLCWEIGGTVGDKSPVILTTAIPNNPRQQWDWNTKPGAILNVASPTQAVDDAARPYPGGPITTFSYDPTNKNQQWVYFMAGFGEVVPKPIATSASELSAGNAT